MREEYQAELGKVSFQVGWLAAAAHDAVTDAVGALAGRDPAAAERVIAGDDELDRRTVELEER
jgi:phosphate uptake regulator